MLTTGCHDEEAGTFWSELASEAVATGDTLLNVKVDLERITSLFTKMVGSASGVPKSSGLGQGICSTRAVGTDPHGMISSHSHRRELVKCSFEADSRSGASNSVMPEGRLEARMEHKVVLHKPSLISNQRATNIGISMARLKVFV